MTRILFVCMGNICRSPTAEGVAKHFINNKKLFDIVEVDSAGTHGYHVGDPPDARTRQAALRRGIDLSAKRARQVRPEDFERFDLLLAMDHDNLDLLRRACPRHFLGKTDLFMHYSTGFAADEVPDPYYGGRDGFELVLDMAQHGVKGLLATLRS